MSKSNDNGKAKLVTFAGTYGYIMLMNILSMLVLGIPVDPSGWIRVLIQALFVTGGLYGANEGINWVYSRQEEKVENGDE